MKLKDNGFKYEYICALTEELDSLAKLIGQEQYDWYHHYILTDDWCINKKCLAIRIPGGTLGGVWIDDDNVITKIVVDTDYVVKTYPKNVNELIQKFVGEVIEF